MLSNVFYELIFEELNVYYTVPVIFLLKFPIFGKILMKVMSSCHLIGETRNLETTETE